MQEFLWTLVGIAFLFILLLIIKSALKKDFCAICGAVTITWATLLLLHSLGLFSNKTIIALLMGHSSLAMYYLFEKKYKKTLFRLPFLITLISLFYFSIEGFSLKSAIFVLLLWIGFFTLKNFKDNKKIRRIAKKIVECCKNI